MRLEKNIKEIELWFFFGNLTCEECDNAKLWEENLTSQELIRHVNEIVPIITQVKLDLWHFPIFLYSLQSTFFWVQWMGTCLSSVSISEFKVP